MQVFLLLSVTSILAKKKTISSFRTLANDEIPSKQSLVKENATKNGIEMNFLNGKLKRLLRLLLRLLFSSFSASNVAKYQT